MKNNSAKHSNDYILRIITFVIVLALLTSSYASTDIEPSMISIQKVSSEPIIISSDADFGSSGYNFPGSGTFGDPYRIEKQDINTEEDYAIEVRDVTSYFVVEGSNLKGSLGGLFISSILPGHTQISNNSFIKIEEGTGIVISSADEVEIKNNNFINTHTAIDCSLSADVTIIDNDIKFGKHGIILKDSPRALIRNNEILTMTGTSIKLQTSHYAQIRLNQLNETGTAMILESDFVEVNNNVIYANDQGILIERSIGSKFSENFIYHNLEGAIYFSTSTVNLKEDNVFYHNYFIANSGGENPQAINSGTNNTWYNTILNEGNYWSDANKTGPYYLGGAIDYYPLIANDRDSDGLDDLNEKYVYFTDLDVNDTDLDELLDGEEVYIHFTNPADSDSDNDRLDDGEEVLIYGTDPLDSDTDDDLLDDYDELMVYFTDVFDPDTDGDSIPDGWEVLKGLDPLIDDSTLDYDDDELSNLDEYYLGTHPFLNDTDYDDLMDGEEVNNYGTDPLDKDTDDDSLYDGVEILIYFTNPLDPDSDNDTLTDGLEVNVYFTNPLSNDTDNDALPDPWEIEYELDPLVDDAEEDPDNDSLTNLGEYLAGTDPFISDTDGDGFLDGKEVKAGTDPLDPNDYPLSSLQISMIVVSSLSVTIVLSLLISKPLKKLILKNR